MNMGIPCSDATSVNVVTSCARRIKMTKLIEEQDNIVHFNDVLTRVNYPNFYFIIGVVNSVYYLQIECEDKCNVTNANITWKSRKWNLSVHMTDGEIVQTAFKAVLTATEHEVREKFTYRDAAIFDPHYDIEKLVE